MTITQDNHYVPQLYLKNFASSSGQIYVYRTLVPKDSDYLWKRFNAAGTGYKKNLYTRISHGAETDDIEKWLNHEFETPAKVPLQKVLYDEALVDSDWYTLVRFLAAQIVRTPAFLLDNLPRWNKMAPKILEQTMKDAERELLEAKKSGKQIVLVDGPNNEYFPMRVLREDLPESKVTKITAKVIVGRGVWFFAMKHTLTKTLNVLHKHKWTILEAPYSLEWFTSDDPVIRLNFRSNESYDFGGGWNRPGVEILLPLSPRHLMYTQVGADSYRRRVPACSRARLIRRLIAEHAHRQIYSSVEDAKIHQLRPRHVDAIAFQHEKALWAEWYENQTTAEKNL